MADLHTRPGGHVIWEQGEKLTEADLERVGTMAEQTVLHLLGRVLEGADGNPISGFFGDDCKVTASGLTATIAAGFGLYFDSASTDEWGTHYKPIVLTTSTTQAINAHHATLNRWDLISLAPATEDDQSASRNVKNLVTGDVASQTVDKRRRWGYTLTYTAGTPATPPTTPATPAGHIAIARIRVPPTSGAVSVDDLRPRLAIPAGTASEPPKEYALNFVPGSSSELAVTQTTPTGMRVLVQGGEAVILGARYRYGYQNVTVTAAHPTNDRTDYIVADADGTIQCLAGTAGGSPPSIADDQVFLASINVTAASTTVTNAQITDQRIRQPHSGTLLRDNSVTAIKMGGTARPIKASLSAGVESSNAVVVGVTAQDADGVAYSGVVQFHARLFSASMEPLSPSNWSVAETGAGTEITTSGSTGLIFSTSSGGVASITVTDDTGSFSGTVYLVVQPLNFPGVSTYAALSYS